MQIRKIGRSERQGSGLYYESVPTFNHRIKLQPAWYKIRSMNVRVPLQSCQQHVDRKLVEELESNSGRMLCCLWERALTRTCCFPIRFSMPEVRLARETPQSGWSI